LTLISETLAVVIARRWRWYLRASARNPTESILIENGFSIDTPRGTQLIAAPAGKEIHCAVPAELCDPFGLSENDAGVSDIQDAPGPHRNLAGWA
jgi:hypothetical protein